MKRITLFLCVSLFVVGASDAANSRDDGRYANSKLKSWFDSLYSELGACCSVADGKVLKAVEWDNLGPNNSYRVLLEGEWVVVPKEAVLTVPNRAGEAYVWTFPTEPKRIRCFLPGAGA